MPLPRLRSLVSLLAGASLIGGAALTTSSGAAGPPADGQVVPDVTYVTYPVNHFVSSCIGYCKHPTNAAKVFRWGLEAWEEEAEVARLHKRWRSNHPSLVDNQFGMLTITAKPHTRVVKVWPDDMKADRGRWEARVRAVELRRGHRTFRFNWELAAVGRHASRCGSRNIVMASYRPGRSKAVRGAVHNRAERFTFSRRMDLRSRAWHTYAVEVTGKRISWFVDTKVVRTERRPAALSGVRLKPRFRIVGARHKTMNLSRMQMDWVRYYDLHRPNARSVAAPKMTRRSSKSAC